MTLRHASCRCGQLRATCAGDPMRVSVCHCLDCQRRSGSAFAAQARFPDEQVTIAGDSATWTHVGEGEQRCTFRFCPICGATIAFANATLPGLTAIPLGTFADPNFPQPDYSVFEERKHGWLRIDGEGIAHFD